MYNCRDIFFPSQSRFGFFVHFGLLTLERTRKVIAPPWYKGGLADETPPLSFWYVAVFRNDFAFSEKPLIRLYKGKYILWVVALLEAYDVTTRGPILAAILDWFYQELKIS